jgi:hypothetical protein
MNHAPDHTEYAGFLFCERTRRTVGEYELGGHDCQHCGASVEVSEP